MTPSRLASTLALVLAIASQASSAGASADLLPFNADYLLFKGSMLIGANSQRLRKDSDATYVFQSNSEPKGLLGRLVGGAIRESSSWRWNEGHIRPLKYSYRRSGHRPRNVSLRFDWERQRVTNTIDQDPWTMTIEPRTVDKLSVQLALMADLAAGRTEMSYPIADGGQLKRYEFEVTGNESVETPHGLLSTLRVVRKRGNSKRHTVLWCAPELGYLPVRVAQYRDGEEYLRMELRNASAPDSADAASASDAAAR